MGETREPSQHRLATTVADDSGGESGGRPARAIALLNYAQALQEYLEEQLPGLWPGRGADKPAQSLAGHLEALDALGSVISLLTAVGAGKQVDVAEFKAVLSQAKAALVEPGSNGGNKLAPMNSEADGDAESLTLCSWSLTRWCVEKLCGGMEELCSDLEKSRGQETQG
jgi:hypothetical protein